MDVRAHLRERGRRVEALLAAALPPADEAPASLHRAMRHLLFPAGKLLRPALCLAAAEAVGAPAERALPAAAAVELVHTYSLIHDDLPCMDDDALRRGRPSVHVAFGEATAVLAGDALLALAFEVLAAGPGEPGRLLAAMGEVARAAGSRELVGGQVADLEFASEAADLARVEWVHARKSAALIAASTAAGALLGGADGPLVARLRGFGLAVGVSFQIADDLLDAERGEPCSLLRVLAPDQAQARAEELLAKALDETQDLGAPAENLRELARYAVRRRE